MCSITEIQKQYIRGSNSFIIAFDIVPESSKANVTAALPAYGSYRVQLVNPSLFINFSMYGTSFDFAPGYRKGLLIAIIIIS